MAHFDEYFYTNIYHGLSDEDEKTIKENVIMFQEGAGLLDSVSSSMSFASIFTGMYGKAGAFLSNVLFEDLKETGQERLNDKVTLIARNEKSAELIKTLYETRGQTPHIIILSELVKRHQDEINELSKKYDRTNVKKAYDSIINHNSFTEKIPISEEVTNGINILSDWINSTDKNKKYDLDTLQKNYSVFMNLSNIGSATGFDELTRVADLAIAGVSIHSSVGALSSVLTSGSITVTGLLNPLTSLICVGAGLFNMFRKKKLSNDTRYMQIIIRQLNMINQQLQSIHKEMRENFKVVFQYLDNIVDKLQMQYNISLNIYYKIEQIEKSISNLTIICEYYGKQNLLQDLYRTVYRITQGTPEYFESMGKTEFNNTCIDIFYWLENHSFDHGTNGYVSGNFNSPIHNRIGYMASLLKFPHATNMANPVIFNICVDALELLIHKGLPYYGTLPMSYDRVIPIMNKANLTEQFIDYSRQPEILANLINHHYIPIVDQLKTSLTEWVNQSNQKYGITNFSHITILNTLEEIISATPIITSQVQATWIHSVSGSVLNHLPYNLSSPGGLFSSIWKICELAKKLGIGYYDFKFNWSHGELYGFKIPIDIAIMTNFVLNGTTYNVYNESWHGVLISLRNNITGELILRNWCHDYNSTIWKLINYTQSNTHFENIIKKACGEKLYSIRQEMIDISHTIGTQVNMLCNKIQEQYIIINKLFEMNNTQLNNLQSGEWIKTRLSQLLNFEDKCGYNVITYCDFIKSQALQVKAEYCDPNIRTNIRSSITKLNELSTSIARYQEEFKYIEDSDKNFREERDKLLEQEEELKNKLIEEKTAKLEQELKNKQQEELNMINSIGMQVGRALTIRNIVKHLEQTGKEEEVCIIRKKYENDLKDSGDLHKVLGDSERINTMFSSSFCNGSSMALLEISMALQRYPKTMCDIQIIGHKILSQILMPPTKTITGAIDSCLMVYNIEVPIPRIVNYFN